MLSEFFEESVGVVRNGHTSILVLYTADWCAVEIKF